MAVNVNSTPGYNKQKTRGVYLSTLRCIRRYSRWKSVYATDAKLFLNSRINQLTTPITEDFLEVSDKAAFTQWPDLGCAIVQSTVDYIFLIMIGNKNATKKQSNLDRKQVSPPLQNLNSNGRRQGGNPEFFQNLFPTIHIPVVSSQQGILQ